MTLTNVKRNHLQSLTCRQCLMCWGGWLPPVLNKSQFLLEEELGTSNHCWLCVFKVHHFSLAYYTNDITQAGTPTGTASARMIKRHCIEMQTIRGVLSQGESSTLLRKEVDYLSDAERQALLKEAGIVSSIGAGEALAIKAGLGLPWAKLRVLRR